MVWDANMINYSIEVIIRWEVELLGVHCLGCCKRKQDGAFQLRKDPATKSDELLEKFQMAFDPALIFGKLCCNFFL